jgi:hypothetical protein
MNVKLFWLHLEVYCFRAEAYDGPDELEYHEHVFDRKNMSFLEILNRKL